MPNSPLLHPDVRELYGSSLRPPPGTVFDAGLATTYSLDFETALAVPVTLALFASESRDDVLASPLALLEGLERTADRLAIFCEGGRIQGQAKAQSRLCSLLERMIIEVAAPNGGAFHPKIWLLRYRPLDEGAESRMRLLILSRNLTRDQSWDLSLCLDGSVGRARQPGNAPLMGLIEHLPGLALAGAPDHAGPLAAELVEDLRRTVWELPPHYEDISFAVNGLGDGAWKPQASSRLAIISPFCDATALTSLAILPRKEAPRLVSRSEELAAIPVDVLEKYQEVLVLDEMAENEDGEDDEDDPATAPPLRGLHAKAFIQERGWWTHLTIGSGNATSPGIIDGRNVEVFATLTGRTSKVGGIDRVFDAKGFGEVLRPFRPGEVSEPDAAQRQAEARVEQARRDLALAGISLNCVEVAQAGGDASIWEMTLVPAGPLRLEGIGRVQIWPITRGENHAVDVLHALRAGQRIRIAEPPLVDVTRFVAFRIADETEKALGLFSLGLEVNGLPAHRHQAILQWVIHSRGEFLRYLRLLLADMEDPLSAQLAAKSLEGGSAWGAGVDDEPILEDMIRALSRHPDRLHSVRRLMEQLEAVSSDGEPSVVPEDFMALWSAFRVVLDEQSVDRA